MAAMRTRVVALSIGGTLLLLGAMLAGLLSWLPASAAEGDATRTVTVSGVGRVSLTPDIVTVQLGVDVRDADLGVAQRQAAERMNQVIAALRASGIAERDIQTSGYNLGVDYDYNKPDRPLLGYYVNQSVSVTVRDVNRAGATIETAVEAGATTVHGVSFGLSDSSAAVREAREQAVVDARARAEELARLTNATLGPVQTVTEGSAMTGGPMPGGFAYDVAASAPPINPGQTEVVVSVTIAYVLN
jgi:uncharacterized protein YggE